MPRLNLLCLSVFLFLTSCSDSQNRVTSSDASEDGVSSDDSDDKNAGNEDGESDSDIDSESGADESAGMDDAVESDGDSDDEEDAEVDDEDENEEEKDDDDNDNTGEDNSAVSDSDSDTDTDTDSDADVERDDDTVDDSDGTCQAECIDRCWMRGGTVVEGICADESLMCCDMGTSSESEDETEDTSQNDSESESSSETGEDNDTGSASQEDSEEESGSDDTEDTSEPEVIVDVSADVVVDTATEHQVIRGFGGMNCPSWISDLTEAQADTAFGNESGQIGMSILRIMVPPDTRNFAREVPTAARAVSHGAIVFATPWSPPTNLKSNGNLIGGRLNASSYGAYADHLISFRDHMESNGVTLHAISVQNEPDIDVSYDSCYWSPQEMISWLTGQASKFGDTKLIVAESFNYNKTITDPILNDPTAEPLFDIIGVHLYGAVGSDYPLAREKNKEIWMTEHYTDSSNDANLWPMALDVADEIHECMIANFNAYIWWYIRRSYGLISENGEVSKRGYMMAQYSKFVRPGFTRVGTTSQGIGNVKVTAYKKGKQVVIVIINRDTSSRTLTVGVNSGTHTTFDKYTSSSSKNVESDGAITATNNVASVTVDGQSVTTLVGGGSK